MPEPLRLNTAGVRLRSGPSTDHDILVDDLGQGTVVMPFTPHAWRHVRLGDGREGWVAQTYLDPAPDAAPPDDEPNRLYTFDTLWPIIVQAAATYGTDPKVVAAITYQESGFRNYLVHHDGTGHGLVGLDDNGLLPDFEQWSGLKIGRGHNARTIPVEPQLHYLAKTLRYYSDKYGDPYTGSRAWHRGEGLMRDARGDNYERVIRAHVRNLFGYGAE